MRIAQEPRHEVVDRETRDSMFLLGLTALFSGTAVGIGLLAIWSLG